MNASAASTPLDRPSTAPSTATAAREPTSVATTSPPTTSSSGRDRLVARLSWPIALWTSYVFLGSLPYKFTNHPDTQHIFTTIGDWLGGFLGTGVGSAFSRFGPYGVGTLELLTSLALLAPIALWLIGTARGRRVGPNRATLHAFAGLVASALMAGAVFFHLASPLGIVVLHEGESDGGSLFYAATSILVLGLVLFAMNVGRARA